MCLMCLPACCQQAIILPCRAKRLSLKKRPRQAATSILPPNGEATGAHVLENGSRNGLGGAFTAPRQACLKGMPSQQKPLLDGTPQASSTDALAQAPTILSSQQAEPHAAARMDDAVRSAAGMSGTIDGSAGPTAGLSEQPLGIPSSKQAEPEAPARPGVPVSTTASMCGANGTSAEPAAGQSGLSVGSRQPLQGWVPRKRNLASFDALDDLPDLSSLGQQRAAQKPLASMPFKAPMRPPGLQNPPEARINSTSGSLSAMPAALTKQVPTLEGSASLSTVVAAASEASQPAGSSAPSRRLQYRKPFAAPRSLQRPEHRASADAGGQAVSSAPSLSPLGKPSVSGRPRVASGALASPAGSGPFPGSICNELEGRQSKGRVPQAQSACRADALNADNSRTDWLPIVEHLPPASGNADLNLMDGPCSSSPPQTLRNMHHSRSASEQQQQQGSMAGIADSQLGSRARLDTVRSSAMEDTTPVCAAGADWAAQRSGRTQSTRRKRLKRLCDVALADSGCSDGPRHASQVCAVASLCSL